MGHVVSAVSISACQGFALAEGCSVQHLCIVIPIEQEETELCFSYCLLTAFSSSGKLAVPAASFLRPKKAVLAFLPGTGPGVQLTHSDRHRDKSACEKNI